MSILRPPVPRVTEMGDSTELSFGPESAVGGEEDFTEDVEEIRRPLESEHMLASYSKPEPRDR